MTWIVTYTGREVDLVEPRPDQICLDDIAHSLSHTCRFAGHTKRFYSVAEHSLHVARLCPTLPALLHDAAEAYIGDVTRPLKHLLGERIAHIERRMQIAIACRFGFAAHELWSDEVKAADDILLWTEKRDVLSPKASRVDWTSPAAKPLGEPLRPMGDPNDVRLAFLARADALASRGSRLTPAERQT